MDYTSEYGELFPRIYYHTDHATHEAQIRRSYGLTIATLRDRVIDLVQKHRVPVKVLRGQSVLILMLPDPWTAPVDTAHAFRSDLRRLCESQGLVITPGDRGAQIRGI